VSEQTENTAQALLELDQACVTFRSRRGGNELRAVDRVSLTVAPGTITGLVGESGSGKSSLARLIVGLNRLAGGEARFAGAALPAGTWPDELRRKVQMIFQDPFSSLNPQMTIGQQLSELLRVRGGVPRAEVAGRSAELLAQVHLPGDLTRARPRQMSGGQRQRVAIAKALAVRPELLVADEPVSALDVSVQAGVIKLFAELRRDLGLAVLFISHDLAVVRHLCDEIAVMYMGRIVEHGSTAEVFADPRHPYTRALLAAIPSVTAKRGETGAVTGDPPSLARLPSGCRFRSRCPLAQERCTLEEPELAEPAGASAGHRAACHFSDRQGD
jgi:oligopeptide/dipeptide ABC transporter ATP-binding protein